MRKITQTKLFTVWVFAFNCLLPTGGALAQTIPDGCAASLKGDTLLLENKVVKKTCLIGPAGLSTLAITNKLQGITWTMDTTLPCFTIPGLHTRAAHPVFKVVPVKASRQMAAHLEASLVISYDSLQLKQVFRIYPGSAAIACDYYLKGNTAAWQQRVVAAGDIKNLESVGASKEGEANAIVADRLALPGKHWTLRSVEFFDATDQNNTLTQEYKSLAYRQEQRLRGNLLFMEATGKGNGLFWLKEAPVSGVQLAYPGFDFSVKFGDFKIAGLGIDAKDINDNEWTRCYSVVTGVFSNGESGADIALRTYQEAIRPQAGITENMILQNTWGDRGQDKNINEAFILNEIQLGAKLGTTHIQLDDGWQSGKSANSAFQGGSFKDIWHKPGYWLPDPVKFPDGFRKIMAAAKAKNMIISTWFNPSVDSSFKYWENDASVLVDQYKTYGIHMWKIDGVRIADKKAEINFRKMLDTVVARTNGEGIFNLDVTAGRRFGYHYFYEYGNLFLENRYTDWANYYPYYTLRNLWMLSKYMPPQRLQIEFLNKWRNTDKYPVNDSLSPSAYSFDYLFAVTMAAQPLAWMEMRNLPAAAYTTATLISAYKRYWKEWHEGMIFPVGQEPSGSSWTGFQSFHSGNNTEGFVLVFRENNKKTTCMIKLTGLEEGKYIFDHLAGNGKTFTTTVKDGNISFILPRERNFAFYRYHKY
ncbi:alpha-galactosidase [Chitinophaga polysaccharea]|uniref:alpha-galactosidase n=1 Tax=Chitinophaga polysaccharea TaxID=1293035 RepID=UPI001157D361|nr:alpha-galactosidase [Chitinophaga polysaccharea]